MPTLPGPLPKTYVPGPEAPAPAAADDNKAIQPATRKAAVGAGRGRGRPALGGTRQAADKPAAVKAPATTPDPQRLTNRQQKSIFLKQLWDKYGPHYADADVRLYLKKREFNSQQQMNRSRAFRRGGFPFNDSFQRPETFLKLSPSFQEVVCKWEGTEHKPCKGWREKPAWCHHNSLILEG